jgi:hypothetical protein
VRIKLHLDFVGMALWNDMNDPNARSALVNVFRLVRQSSELSQMPILPRPARHFFGLIPFMDRWAPQQPPSKTGEMTDLSLRLGNCDATWVERPASKSLITCLLVRDRAGVRNGVRFGTGI